MLVSQVFDLAAPADPRIITLADLQGCGAGGDIVGILADVTAFWEHDSKEALLAVAGDAAPNAAEAGEGCSDHIECGAEEL